MNHPAYPLAPNGVFATVQGEGPLAGLPMVFVRLAGCSVGCDHCDTDYRVHERATAGEVRDRVARLVYGGVRWAWVTGGEPTDHDLGPLYAALRGCGLKVALATAGVREVGLGCLWGGPDHVSVSPHDPARWVKRSGDALNLVPGLNGLSLRDPSLLAALKDCERDFPHRSVTPLADREGRPTNLDECLAFVRARPGWRLGCQCHKLWRLP